MPIGVIMTLGPPSNAEVLDLLDKAGLEGFLHPQGFVSEHDVNENSKARVEIVVKLFL